MKNIQELDIDKMFAEAAGAAEDTGEKDPSIANNTPPKKTKSVEQTKSTETTKPNKTSQSKENSVDDVNKNSQQNKSSQNKSSKATKTTEDNKDNMKPKRTPLLQSNMKNTVSTDIIKRIIEMKNVLDNYNKEELEFVKGHFQVEGNFEDIIYNALNTDTNALEALNNIVVAKEHTAADRAFYLMELSNNHIESIYEQIYLWTDQLDNNIKITNDNKIAICRTLEQVIANMNNDMFSYIDKLQSFTSLALYK